MNWLIGWPSGWFLNWFGVSEDPSAPPSYGDSAAGTLVLDFEQGFTVVHKWETDVHKFRSGQERRISRNDAAKQSISGTAYLASDNPRAMRAKMARYAALGAKFLVGLPHEAMAFSQAASGSTVYVEAEALALCDWRNIGQRVVCARRLPGSRETQFVEAVIQGGDLSSLVLSVEPGALASPGGLIMPLVPVYLEPQQDFERYRVSVERWNLAARVISFDFAPALARLYLGSVEADTMLDAFIGPLTASAAFDHVTILSRQFGLIGNTRSFSLSSASYASAYNVLEESDGAVVYHYEAGVTTLGEMADTLSASQYVVMSGSWTDSDTIAADDAFAATQLYGGVASGPVGTGAPLTRYNGDGANRLVWDRRIESPATVTDSVHAMTVIVDHGAIPYAIPTASRADWGRAVVLTGKDQREWQWWKRFMFNLKGKQRAFWLPTWRKDLTFVEASIDDNTVTISTEDDSDFTAWWPEQREHIQILNTDGSVKYAKITEAIDNGDGSRTLTLEGCVLTTDAVSMISWLELARFEGDTFTVKVGGKQFFSFSSLARAVQQ